VKIFLLPGIKIQGLMALALMTYSHVRLEYGKKSSMLKGVSV